MSIPIGICSFSFHRLMAAGKQDIFKFITDCKDLGCTQLDPWNAQLATIRSGDEVIHAGRNPGQSQHLSAGDEEYIQQVRQAADKAGLPFGTIAVDGAHIYEDDAEKRKANRARAYRWLDVAHQLGATQVRIDAGGPEEMPAEVFKIIQEGYHDLIARGRPFGIEILIENHWGPSVLPDNVLKLMEHIPGLGLLLDSFNWKPEKREEGRRRCAKYATATHFKTFSFDARGDELEADIPGAIRYLKDAGYKGCWGVESVPKDGDEIGAARKTIALIKTCVAA